MQIFALAAIILVVIGFMTAIIINDRDLNQLLNDK